MNITCISIVLLSIISIPNIFIKIIIDRNYFNYFFAGTPLHQLSNFYHNIPVFLIYLLHRLWRFSFIFFVHMRSNPVCQNVGNIFHFWGIKVFFEMRLVNRCFCIILQVNRARKKIVAYIRKWFCPVCISWKIKELPSNSYFIIKL